MSYTMSFDASVKLKRSNVRGWLRHAGRDLDMQNGTPINHANPNIDDDATLDNMTFVYDSSQGGFRRAKSVSEIDKALAERLTHVEKPLRKDAVVARPLILQLDPEWYEEHDKDEWGDSYDAMMEWAVDRFGAENLIAISVHEDESSPHMHLLFCPVTEDGRLSQKDWFANPSALREMHQDLRTHMRDQGYEVDMQNRKPGKHARRMSDAEYRDFAELQNEGKKLDATKRSVSRREANVVAREKEVLRREKALDAREAALDAREVVLQERAEAQKKRASELALQAQTLAQAQRDLDTRRVRREQRVEQATAQSDRITGTTGTKRRLPSLDAPDL